MQISSLQVLQRWKGLDLACRRENDQNIMAVPRFFEEKKWLFTIFELPQWIWQLILVLDTNNWSTTQAYVHTEKVYNNVGVYSILGSIIDLCALFLN